jgi:hypothetical protein
MGLKLLANLQQNLEELNINEKSISLVELEIFERASQRVVSNKSKEMRRILNEKASSFKQDPTNYKQTIDEYVAQFEKGLQKIVNLYLKIFDNAFEVIQSSRNNQKICITNIVTLEKKKLYAEDKKELQDIVNLQIKCAQKKLNYQALINEANARLLWAITNMEEAVLSVYSGDTLELSTKVKRSSIFRKINIFFTGKKQYKRYLEDFGKVNFRKINQSIDAKAGETIVVLAGFIRQVDDMNRQLKRAYEKASA